MAGGPTFLAPTSVDAAVDAMQTYAGSARLLAGGMSLLPIMNLGLADPEVIVSLNHVSGLSDIREDGEQIRIGAMARHCDVAADATIVRHCPVLATAASRIGDVQVRNRGTIGGSISHADPSADYAPVLTAVGATVVTRSARGERETPMRDFVLGIMETSVAPDEILVEVRLPKTPPSVAASYVRLARVEGSFAVANAAAILTPETVTVTLGAIRPIPLLLTGDGSGSAEDLESRVDSLVEEALTLGGRDNDELSAYKDAMAAVCARRAVAAARLELNP